MNVKNYCYRVEKLCKVVKNYSNCSDVVFATLNLIYAVEL